MEYILQLEKNHRYKLLIAFMLFMLFGFFFLFQFMGIYGLIFFAALMLFIVVSPLLAGKEKLLLFIWIFLVPVFETLLTFKIGGINPFNYFFTGLTLPIGLYLMNKHMNSSMKEIPFVKYIILLQVIISLNFLRPFLSIIDIFEDFKLYISCVFIIYITYSFLKNNDFEKSCKMLFNWINIYIILNGLVALFQRITGIGLMIVETVPRIRGLTAHPNGLGLMTVIYFPLGLYMFLKAKNTKEKIFWGTGLFLSLLALLLSFCKTAIVLLVISFGIFSLVLSNKLKVRIFTGVFALFISFMILDQILNLGIVVNFLERFNNNSSFTWRLSIWGYILKNMNFGTFLIGNGSKSVESLLAVSNSGIAFSSHNMYLKYLYEYGFWGLIYYLSFITLAIKFLKIYLTKKIKDYEFYIVPFIITLIILIDSFFDPAGQCRVVMNIGWVLLTIFCLKANKGKAVK